MSAAADIGTTLQKLQISMRLLTIIVFFRSLLQSTAHNVDEKHIMWPHK